MNDMPVVESLNPYRSAPVVAAPQNDSVMAVAASSREVAEVQTSMLMARRFPRNEMEAMDRILQACTRPTLAEGALYEFARGGSEIRGPSIRLAECLAGYWGHISCGWRVLEERPGATKIQAYAWDLQTGTRHDITFDVVHEVGTRGGKKQLHDPRDIYEHCASSASRRLRACILRVIPRDVQDAAVNQCEKTMHTKLEVTPELVRKILTQFAEFNVGKTHIEKRIQRHLEAISPGMVVQLGKIYTSLKDGMSSPKDWFDVGGGELTDVDAPAAAPEAPSAPTEPGPAPNPRVAVREKLAAQRRARGGGSPDEPMVPPPPPAPPADVFTLQTPPSQALQDIVRFAKAARDKDDIGRVRQIALQLDDEEEAILAQQHIDAAAARIK